MFKYLQRLQELKALLLFQRIANNRLFRVSYRAGRVVVLTTAIYQLGYQSGITFYARNPLDAKKILLAQALELPLQNQDKQLHPPHSADHRRLQRIVDRVIAEARRRE